ncbi:MAG: ferredoxin family protein [Acidilobus sp.]
MAGKAWHGVDRSKYVWFPTIDYDKCTGCGLCLLTCGSDVFRWDPEGGLPVVANPGNCVLGCTTCARLCPEGAITFPDDPKRFVRSVIIKEKAFPTVREELKERLSKYPDHRVSAGKVVTLGPSPEFSKWHGIDRRAINWGPVIDEDKCLGCGMCVVQCSERRNVFGFDEKGRKAVVLAPQDCMVGCNNCQIACLWDAIKFPDPSELKELARKLVDSGRAREELEVRLKQNPNLLIRLPPAKRSRPPEQLISSQP